MGERTITLRFCDSCQKELVGRLTFRTCPCCGKDICLACLEKENTKHKPRERKPKTETLMPQTTTISPEIFTQSVDSGTDVISTFYVVTGQDGKSHTLNMGGTFVSNKTLRAGAKELLGLTGLTEEDIKGAPESEGKRNLLNILNPK